MSSPRTLVLRVLVSLIFFLSACTERGTMSIHRSDFGVLDDQPVSLWTLTNSHGLVVKITDYGATVTECHIPDRDGKVSDIVLGFETLDRYVADSPYFGAMVGRVANRIAGGAFGLDGVEYDLERNNGPHHLHGGARGFDKVLWSGEEVIEEDRVSLKLRYTSKDGEEGYPGTLELSVVYSLTEDNALEVAVVGTTDRSTPINIAHHSYWNLAGHDGGDVLGQRLQVDADFYTPSDKTLIPTGLLSPVDGTAFDFRTAREIGADLAQLPGDGQEDPGGYDVNFVLRGVEGEWKRAARVSDPGSGRFLEIWTDAPGVQFYSGNFLDGFSGKGGAHYGKYHGFCLETQRFPDAIHHRGEPGWPEVILRPGEIYRHRMRHQFGVEE